MTTTWPEGVIARYLTVGGATVDITQDSRHFDGIAACTGCDKTERFDRVGAGCWGGPDYALQRNTEEARRWAQAHAETCRAMPRQAGLN